MSTFKCTRPTALYMLLAGLLFQGLSGLLGGGALIIDPSGELLQIPQSLLEESFFRDFTIPGSILFWVLGVFPLIAFYGLWRQITWAWLAALLVGVALVGWIMLEILIVGYQSQPPLQLIYGLLGVTLLVLALLPSVRQYSTKSRRHLQV